MEELHAQLCEGNKVQLCQETSETPDAESPFPIWERQIAVGMTAEWDSSNPAAPWNLINMTGAYAYSLEELKAYVNWITKKRSAFYHLIHPEHTEGFPSLLDDANWADAADSIPELMSMLAEITQTYYRDDFYEADIDFTRETLRAPTTSSDHFNTRQEAVDDAVTKFGYLEGISPRNVLNGRTNVTQSTHTGKFYASLLWYRQRRIITLPNHVARQLTMWGRTPGSTVSTPDTWGYPPAEYFGWTTHGLNEYLKWFEGTESQVEELDTGFVGLETVPDLASDAPHVYGGSFTRGFALNTNFGVAKWDFTDGGGVGEVSELKVQLCTPPMPVICNPPFTQSAWMETVANSIWPFHGLKETYQVSGDFVHYIYNWSNCSDGGGMESVNVGSFDLTVTARDGYDGLGGQRFFSWQGEVGAIRVSLYFSYERDPLNSFWDLCKWSAQVRRYIDIHRIATSEGRKVADGYWKLPPGNYPEVFKMCYMRHLGSQPSNDMDLFNVVVQ